MGQEFQEHELHWKTEATKPDHLGE